MKDGMFSSCLFLLLCSVPAFSLSTVVAPHHFCSLLHQGACLSGPYAHTALSGLQRALHTVSSKQSIFFPNKMLVQYDSGKLQVLEYCSFCT
jgi:hypothetical protein